MHQQIRTWSTPTITTTTAGEGISSERNTTTSSTTNAAAVSSSNASPCYPVTGVDWTNGKAPVGATKRQAMGCSWEEAFIGGSSTKMNTYKPLLSRPMEKTYEQKVNSLSGHKRERQEINMSKRAQGNKEEDTI
eukprot:TRINITY_DN19092_c0_g1_i1.p1 TRINITY_DN19092_c0_g1~~TRINITY_DN19092_c0_g1_i1.p1  ORF type:complete len:134 (+),score=15.42 TRINITY_DN19092_c0_g1_i1:500-901(+)